LSAQVAPLAITPLERVWVSERFFEHGYTVAIAATLALCGAGVILAFADQQSAPAATISITAVLVVVALSLRGSAGYLRLRKHPIVLAAVGPAVALSALWPPVDENALYFPVLGTLAIVACVATRVRQSVAVVASVAAGTAVAALLDHRSPQLATAEQLVTATLGVLICGALLCAIVAWCGVWVLEQAHAPTVGPPPLIPTPMPASANPEAAADDPPTPGEPSWLPLRVAESLARWILAIRDRLWTDRYRDESTKLSGFSARELQVLLLRAGEFSRTEIAGFLSIGVETVKTIEKRAVRRRRDAVAATHGKTLQQPRFDHRAVTRATIQAELLTRFPNDESIEALATRAGDRGGDAPGISP
jgi:DNA-binding CsgD family transcriptional regulator